MQDSTQYRVMDRKRFAVVMVVLVSLLAVGVWISLDRIAEYAEQLKSLAVTDPAGAAASATQLMRILAILNGLVLGALTILIIWHGWSGWRAEAMPPPGSRILAGQRTWTGESAVRIAKFNIVAGALLGVLAVASSLILWSLGEWVVDAASRGACMHHPEMSEMANGDANDRSKQLHFYAATQVRCGSMPASLA